MIYPSIDKLLNEVGSKYLLVNLVSKRVKEMEEKKNYQMSDNEYVSHKNIGKALYSPSLSTGIQCRFSLSPVCVTLLQVKLRVPFGFIKK